MGKAGEWGRALEAQQKLTPAEQQRLQRLLAEARRSSK